MLPFPFLVYLDVFLDHGLCATHSDRRCCRASRYVKCRNTLLVVTSRPMSYVPSDSVLRFRNIWEKRRPQVMSVKVLSNDLANVRYRSPFDHVRIFVPVLRVRQYGITRVSVAAEGGCSPYRANSLLSGDFSLREHYHSRRDPRLIQEPFGRCTNGLNCPSGCLGGFSVASLLFCVFGILANKY